MHLASLQTDGLVSEEENEEPYSKEAEAYTNAGYETGPMSRPSPLITKGLKEPADPRDVEVSGVPLYLTMSYGWPWVQEYSMSGAIITTSVTLFQLKFLAKLRIVIMHPNVKAY